MDKVNKPGHYTQGRVECIDALESLVADKGPEEAVLVANVVKYVWRYRRKDGVQDLRKAQWYLARLIERLAAEDEEAHQKAVAAALGPKVEG